MLTLTFRLLRYSSTLSALKPFGEGQVDKAINRHNRGENTHCLLNPTIDLEPRLAHHTEKDSSPCPLPWKPTGCCAKGQTDMPINRHNRGEVPYDASVG